MDDYNNINHNFEAFGDGLQEGEGNQLYAYGSEPGSMLVNGQPVAYSRSSASANSLWIQESNQQLQQIQCSMFSQLKLVAYSSGGNAIMTEVYPDGHSIQNQYYFRPGYNEIVFAPDVPGRHTLGYNVNGKLSNTVIIDVIDQNRERPTAYAPSVQPLVEQNLTVKYPVVHNYSVDSSSDEVSGNSLTWDFENGDLSGWEKIGDAFDNAPRVLSPVHIIGWINKNNQGTNWINSADESTGALTSQPFVINGDKISFLIGGSKYQPHWGPFQDFEYYAALIIDEYAVEIDIGQGNYTMERIEWDVSRYRGKTAEIQLVDNSSEGHISFDDVMFDVPPTIVHRFTVKEGESIQAAIERSSPGDLIEVYSGTYAENLNIDKKLNLYGVDTGEGNPVIDARNLGSAITVSSDGVNLGWFEVTNSGHDAGIKVYSSDNNIHNIIASNNYVGILLSQNGRNTINSTKISGTGAGSYGGLVLEDSDNNLISGIDVKANDMGISLMNSRSNRILQWIDPITKRTKDNEISGNRIGIKLSNSYDNNLKYNNLSGNDESAFDDGNNQWSYNYYGEIPGESPSGSTYSIPGGSSFDSHANAIQWVPYSSKMGKAKSKVHEKESKKKR